MTKKEKLQQLALWKAEKQALDMQIKELQRELLSEWDWDFDLNWVRVYEKTNIRYDFNKSESEEFEKEFPELITKKYLTKWLSEDQKRKFFKKSVSTPFIMFE